MDFQSFSKYIEQRQYRYREPAESLPPSDSVIQAVGRRIEEIDSEIAELKKRLKALYTKREQMMISSGGGWADAGYAQQHGYEPSHWDASTTLVPPHIYQQYKRELEAEREREQVQGREKRLQQAQKDIRWLGGERVYALARELEDRESGRYPAPQDISAKQAKRIMKYLQKKHGYDDRYYNPYSYDPKNHTFDVDHED